MALFNFALFAKVIVIDPVVLFVKSLDKKGGLFDILGALWWALDPTPERVALLIVGLFLISWFNLFEIGFMSGLDHWFASWAWRPHYPVVRTLFALMHGIPSSPYRSNGGHGPLTMFFVHTQSWALVSPRPLPDYLTLYPAFASGHVRPKSVISVIFFGLMALEQLYLFNLHAKAPAVKRPWHPEDLPEFTVVPAPVPKDFQPPPMILPTVTTPPPPLPPVPAVPDPVYVPVGRIPAEEPILQDSASDSSIAISRIIVSPAPEDLYVALAAPDLGVVSCANHGTIAVIGESGPHLGITPNFQCGCPIAAGDHAPAANVVIHRVGPTWHSNYHQSAPPYNETTAPVAPLPQSAPPRELPPEPTVEPIPIPPVPPPVQPVLLPPPPLPQSVLPAYAPDLYAAWNIPPLAYPNFNAWRNVVAGLPFAHFPRVDPALICTWDSIGRTIALPPLLCLSLFLASLPVQDRAQFEDGIVLVEQLPRVLAYFPAAWNVYSTLLRNGATVMDVNTTPTIATQPHLGWPSQELALYPTAQGGVWHITVGPIQRAAGIGPQVPLPHAPLQLSSARLPIAQIAANLQVPQAWYTVYDRMTGVFGNAAGLAIGAAGAVRGLPPLVNLPLNPVRPQIFRYQLDDYDSLVARNLARDLFAHPQVLEYHDTGGYSATSIIKGFGISAKQQSSLPRSLRKDVEFVLLMGVPSAGKSHWIRSQISTWESQGPVRFHSWNNTLRPQLQASFERYLQNPTERSFTTKYVPMFQVDRGTLIFDDAGLLPPGYIQLLIAHTPIERIVCTFDPAQQTPPFPEADAMTRSIERTAPWLTNLAQANPGAAYGTVGYRLAVETSQLFGLPRALVANNIIYHANVYIVAQPPHNVPYFVTSPRFAQSVSHGSQAFPISECQGLDVDGDIAIDLGGLSTSITDHQAWTALTRAKGNIFLVLPPTPAANAHLVEASWGRSTIISAILAVAARYNTPIVNSRIDVDRLVARAVQGHLSRALPMQVVTSLGLQPPQQAIAGNPHALNRDFGIPALPPPSSLPPSIHWTAALAQTYHGNRYDRPGSWTAMPEYVPVQHTKRERIADLLRHRTLIDQDTTLSVPLKPPEPLPTPRVADVPDPAIGVHEVRWAQGREKYIPGEGYTMAFNPNRSPLGQTHSRRDGALEKFSYAERIHPAEPLTRSRHRNNAKRLMKGLAKWVDFKDNPGLNRGLLQQCYDDRLQSWLSHRTTRQIALSIQRAEVDWPRDFVKLFLKGQRIKKLDVAHTGLKKGQIVTDMSHAQLFSDDVWALYLERSLMKAKRPNVYLHARASIGDMQRWYSKFWDPGAKVTYTDYTGWDTGVDESFTILYSETMIRFGIPARIAKKFAEDRHSRRSFMGPMPAMQASGDRYTWLNNTIGNMALTGISFDIDSSTVAAFSGDDMILCGEPHYSNPGRSFHFLPKLTVSNQGEFCGYMFGGGQLYVSPNVLLHRYTIALEDGRKDYDFWESANYALHYADRGNMEPDLVYDSAANVVRSAYDMFNLPPPKHPIPTVT
jgi:hypothetical protein